ncbi:MAG: histidine phosphatase family protein [Candidatus Riflebacteria bacterium]|nr:histidine phosphatase family protein [Candidatus Riflebacteria bacterium]
MTTVCLVRHGETDWNRDGRLQGLEDIELNSNGKRQAEMCGEYLKRECWETIVCSTLKRARETALIIKDVTGIKSFFEKSSLTERDFGKLSGLTPVERQTAMKNNIKPNEELKDFRNRTVSALNDIAKDFAGKKIIVVTHGGVINSLLSYVSKGAIENGENLLKNACVSIIQYDNSDWKIQLYNKMLE